MNKFVYLAGFLLFSLNFCAQTLKNKDTIYIIFNDQYKEMRKVDFTHQMQAGSQFEKLKKSFDYYIEQMEPSKGYDFEFNFTHANRSQETNKKFNIQSPLIKKKPKSFLDNKKVLDIEFFKTTPYIQIAKTFEKEDSWEQDVVIFIVDVDEIQNNCILLREVKFSRPVKQ